MRRYGWAALAVVLGFVLRAPAAPIIVTATSPNQPPLLLRPLGLTSFLISPSRLTSFFPSIPSIGSPNTPATTASIPLKDGVPTKDYFKLFGLAAPPRAQ